jgi:hypothetical protein
VLLVVVGGITFAELHAVREAWRGDAGLPPVSVLSNCIAGPDHMYGHVVATASPSHA